MDEKLKYLMQELGKAINQSLSESDPIAAAIHEIRRAGYEVFLVLEATIGFNRREASSGDEVEGEDAEIGAKPEFETAGKFRWTSQDQKFLKALKIAVDEDSHA